MHDIVNNFCKLIRYCMFSIIYRSGKIIGNIIHKFIIIRCYCIVPYPNFIRLAVNCWMLSSKFWGVCFILLKVVVIRQGNFLRLWNALLKNFWLIHPTDQSAYSCIWLDFCIKPKLPLFNKCCHNLILGEFKLDDTSTLEIQGACEGLKRS